MLIKEKICTSTFPHAICCFFYTYVFRRSKMDTLRVLSNLIWTSRMTSICLDKYVDHLCHFCIHEQHVKKLPKTEHTRMINKY